jgi:16S rRNA (guanine966-N2)-methyltransferase
VRIVGGQFRGRPLAAPDDGSTRPTSDRVREALFNVLAHGIPDFRLEGARVLDLFAGTGALGLEAISRGARYCLFIEDEPKARALVRENVEAFGLTGITRIWRRDATKLGPANTRDAFDLVFLDPPYGKGLGEQALVAARDGGWLQGGAVVVLEERADVIVDWPQSFRTFDRREWGGTQVVFARFESAARDMKVTSP